MTLQERLSATTEALRRNNMDAYCVDTAAEVVPLVRRLLTAKGVTISVTAKRNVGDDGNDFVAGLAWKNGRDAEADFQWTFPDGTVVLFSDAVINVTNVGSADSTNVAPLEFEVQSNGKPTVTPAGG